MGRNGDAALVLFGQPLRTIAVVGFVEDKEFRHIARSDLLEDLTHGIHRPHRVVPIPVDHVNEQVGITHNVEGRFERRDELMRQLAHEPDGVGGENRLTAGQGQTAGGGVECGKESILDMNIGPSKAVEQRRFAGVGVPDERDRPVAGARALFRLCLAMRLDLAQVGLELVHPTHETATVDLKLGLARTSGADTAALLGEGAAARAKAREAVAQLGKFHLGLTFLAAGVLGENVENDGGAVERRPAENLLEVVLLGRGELVVKDNRVGIDRVGRRLDLLGLTGTDVGGRIR